jgi:hypothetical protein
MILVINLITCYLQPEGISKRLSKKLTFII